MPRLLEGDEADYHAYAFHNPRMAGASFELLASHVRWLLGEEGETAAAGPGRRRRRHQDAAVPARPSTGVRHRRRDRPDGRGLGDRDGRARRLVGWQCGSVLEFERTTPDPGPDADGVEHRFLAIADVEAATDAVLEIGGIATVWDVLVNGAVVASGTSMFERREVGVALVAGSNTVEVVVHPLSTWLDEQPRKPRARWRTMVTDEPRLRWARTQVLGRAPGFAPGPPVVGPYRPMVLSTDADPPVENGRVGGLWSPHTHGDEEGRRERSRTGRSTRSSCG